MQKKLLVILLALSLLVALSVPVFAIGSESGNVDVLIDSDGDGTPDSEENPSDIDPASRVYSVNVTWESLDFMFSGTWNPEKAEYEGAWMTNNGEGWTADNAQTITVENRSNVSVSVSATMDTTEKYGVSASLSANASGTELGSAAEADAVVNGVGPSVDFTVTVEGNPTVSDGFTVGQITVTFTAN